MQILNRFAKSTAFSKAQSCVLPRCSRTMRGDAPATGIFFVIYGSGKSAN